VLAALRTPTRRTKLLTAIENYDPARDDQEWSQYFSVKDTINQSMPPGEKAEFLNLLGSKRCAALFKHCLLCLLTHGLPHLLGCWLCFCWHLIFLSYQKVCNLTKSDYVFSTFYTLQIFIGIK
jgi:hypothetical protein